MKLKFEGTKNIADREDYVVAWWDYGCIVHYYADVKTLVDGRKLIRSSTIVSFALTKDIVSSAKYGKGWLVHRAKFLMKLLKMAK